MIKSQYIFIVATAIYVFSTSLVSASWDEQKAGCYYNRDSKKIKCGKGNTDTPDKYRDIEIIPKKEPKESLEKELYEIKKKLRIKYETESFRIDSYWNNELVKGRKGKYYVVSLKNPQASQILHFDAGQYIIDSYKEKYFRSLNDFAAEILGVVDKACAYKLYVRGGADKPRYRGDLSANYYFQQFQFLKQIGGDQYSGLAVHAIANQYTNADLPNLRAAFLQHIFKEKYQDYIKEVPVILEGSVSNRLEEEDRNAEIFLYLDDKSC